MPQRPTPVVKHLAVLMILATALGIASGAAFGRQEFADGPRTAFSSRQSDLANLPLIGMQLPQLDALRKAADKNVEATEKAQQSGESHNPFTLAAVMQWLRDHGPKLVGILLGMLAIYATLGIAGRHLSAALARTSRRGTLHERENRAVTLMSVFRNVVSITVITGGALMVLDEVGIPVVPLMGGAAVVGLAVAFGAQNLVRDYFAGFMVLLEDQYGINDVVKIGDISGAVELITLRITVLRDLEGTVHFVPHGSITTVSNMTHGWSRALLDIGVAYKEDTDRVMEVMLDVARTLRKNPDFESYILDDAEMLGVDNLGDSAVVIKMCIKTQPLKRWAVKREMLRQIKHKFDELGIEIPFPHRTVFLHSENDDAAAVPDDQDNRSAA